MLSSRVSASPRFQGQSFDDFGYITPLTSSRNTAAELLQLPARQALGTRPLSPSTTSTGTVRPRGNSTFPSWCDATLQCTIQQIVQVMLNQQLDSVMESVANVSASAQHQIRELEKVFERQEVHLEGRFSTIESRVSMIADGFSRSEQRERDLNERIGGIAEQLLRNISVPTSGHEVTIAPRLSDLETRGREITSRLDRLEDASRKSSKIVRSLDERQSQTTRQIEATHGSLHEIKAQFEEMWQLVDDPSFRRSSPNNEIAERLAHLEEQVCSMNFASANDITAQVIRLSSKVEDFSGVVDVLKENMENRFKDFHKQADDTKRRQEEARFQIKSLSDHQQTNSARVDEVNIAVGQLKVKTESVDGRVSHINARLESILQLPEDSEEARHRVDVLERRLDGLSEDCEDLVEQALERRLAILAGAAPLPSSRSSAGLCSLRSNRPRHGTPSTIASELVGNLY